MKQKHTKAAHDDMEPLESPRVTQVGGILSTGEDTDGERTDDEVDYPTDSFVSQHQEEEGAQCVRICVLIVLPSAVLPRLRLPAAMRKSTGTVDTAAVPRYTESPYVTVFRHECLEYDSCKGSSVHALQGAHRIVQILSCPFLLLPAVRTTCVYSESVTVSQESCTAVTYIVYVDIPRQKAL